MSPRPSARCVLHVVVVLVVGGCGGDSTGTQADATTSGSSGAPDTAEIDCGDGAPGG